MSKKLILILTVLLALIVILIICSSISKINSRTRDTVTCVDEKNKTIKEHKEDSDNEDKVAFLTFDDGPSKNTPAVLDILDKYKIKATFFVVGSLVEEYGSDYLKDTYNKGHSIGIHTYSHKYNQIYLSKDSYIQDFNKAKKCVKNVIGIEPCIYRFPGGSCNCFIACIKKDIIDELGTKGYCYYDWNVSGEDSVNRPTVSSIINNVLKDYKAYTRPIILLHDGPGNANTVKALPKIIESIRESGYAFDVLK